MQGNFIITGGSAYVDIDVYASCIAYRELLRATGVSAYAVTTAAPNESVSDLVRKVPLKFDDYVPTENDKFIVLDLSNPTYFDSVVARDRLVELIDHHTGFEDYWRAQTDVKSQIEFIGAVATIIFERFVEAARTDALTPDLCRLLVAAIVDNTLNLKASITTDRDRFAFTELMRIGNIPHDFPQIYLEDCEREMLQNLERTITSSVKNDPSEMIPNILAQLLVYNHEKILDVADEINKIFIASDDWAINIISLKDGKSHILAGGSTAKTKFERLFAKKFVGDVLELDPFMLRKEIKAKSQKIT